MMAPILGALLLAVLTLLTLLAPAPLHAQQLGFQGASPKVTLGDVLEAEATFTVRHKGQATDFFITFGPGAAGTFDPREMTDGTNVLQYVVWDNASSQNLLKDLSVSVTNDNVLVGSFPAQTGGGGWQRQDLTVTVRVSGGFYRAGNYTDAVAMTLYSGTLAANTQEDTSTLDVDAKIQAKSEVSIVAPGGLFDVNATDYTMDFGLFSSGQSREADLIARSNVPYSLSLTSQNGGVFTYTAGGDTSTVPYSLFFDGTEVSLPAGTAVTVVPSAAETTIDGTRYPLEVVIGSLGVATEGQYDDVITVDIAAL